MVSPLAMRVLIVEDDPLLGDALAVGLRQRGQVIDWFTKGADADAALRATAYDAVVLDLGLPGGDGMEWLARWRARALDIPVLILTARDAVEQRIGGLDVGADDYLVKPLATDELMARLRAVVRRSTGRAQSVWQHGALEYDPATRVVRWNGQMVELTTRETDLLAALMKHPEHVLSKARLQALMYDWSDAEPESNTLEVHIHRLRRKIDPRIVRTVRGVGYALGSGDSSA